MEKKPSWYDTSGFNFVETQLERQNKLNGPKEFWVKVGTSKDFVLIDDDPFNVFRHTIHNGERWESFTCLRGTEHEPICCAALGERNRSGVSYFTVVDCSSYVDKNGNTHQFNISLFPAKFQTLQKFRRKKLDRGSLAGCLIRAARDTQKEPATGGDFDVLKDADMDKVFRAAMYRGKKFSEIIQQSDPVQLNLLRNTFNLASDEKGQVLQRLVPFNYVSVLEPPSLDEVKAYLGSHKDNSLAASKGGSAAGAGVPAADDIAF